MTDATLNTSLQALLPAAVLSLGIVVLMMQIAFKRHPQLSWVITCLSLILAAATTMSASDVIPHQAGPLLVVDQYSLFFTLVFLFAGLITAMISREYLQTRPGENEEFYLLLLLSTLGGLILVSASHLASFLLGLELLSVALYALIAYPERGQLPLEAAIKYLVLSGAASAVLLFGFALIYAALGTLSFTGIGQQLVGQAGADNQLLIAAGTAMVFVGVGFKLSVVPFHMWTPDVYQGAPAPVTGFLATVSKGAVFVALMRLFLAAELYQYSGLMVGISVLACTSMLAGNLLALKQKNLKRLLAYSSIAHLGYLLITLVVCGALWDGQFAVEASSYYLAAYITTSLAAFAAVSMLSSNAEGTEQETIAAVEGLFWRQPLLATMFTIALLSLAGIPLTVGFIGKFYIFTAGIEGSLWLLLATLVVGSGIGIYYYLRIVFAMTKKATVSLDTAPDNADTSVVNTSIVMALIFLMLLLGTYPQPLMEYLRIIL